MGLYMNAYAGAYIVLTNLTYKEEKTTQSSVYTCPNGNHGKQKNKKFCNECGSKIQITTKDNVHKKTVNRSWFDINYEFEHVEHEINTKIILIPQDNVNGNWKIDLPKNFCERGGGGCILANKFNNEMKTAFNKKYEKYINFLIQKGFNVDVNVGLFVWWS